MESQRMSYYYSDGASGRGISAETVSVGTVPVTYLQGKAAGMHQIGHGDCAAPAYPQAGEHQHCSHVQLSI